MMSRLRLVLVGVLVLAAGLPAIVLTTAGCRSIPAVAPTITPTSTVTLREVKEAVIETIQTTVQHTVTQSFHDLGDKQLDLEKTRLAREWRFVGAAAPSAIGFLLLCLLLPSVRLPMLYEIVGYALAVVMICAPWALLLLL
jgi:hypothetical protein